MPRHNGNKSFKQHRNLGQHQRRRTTRGGRTMSKLKKYKHYQFEKEMQHGSNMSVQPRRIM